MANHATLRLHGDALTMYERSVVKSKDVGLKDGVSRSVKGPRLDPLNILPFRSGPISNYITEETKGKLEKNNSLKL